MLLKEGGEPMPGPFLRKIGFAAILAMPLCLYLAFPSLGLAACAVDPDVPLAITRFAWTFSPKTGLFQLEGEVLNVSARDVLDPGIAVSLLDGGDKEYESGVARSALKRIRPGESASVKLSAKAARMPGTVKVLPFFGIAGT